MKRKERYEKYLQDTLVYYTTIYTETAPEIKDIGLRWYPDAIKSLKEFGKILNDKYEYEYLAESLAGFNQNLGWEISLIEFSAYVINPEVYINSGRNSYLSFLKNGSIKHTRKLRDFYLALVGDEYSIPIDRHMVPPFFPTLTDLRYRVCQEAIYILSENISINPRETQAIVWCGVRSKKNYRPATGRFSAEYIYNAGKELLEKL